MSKKTNSAPVTANGSPQQPPPKGIQEGAISDGKAYGERRKKKLRLMIFVLLLVVAAVGVAVLHESQKNRASNIVIGSITITPKAISEFSQEVTTYSKANSVKFGQPAKRVAQDDLILNAALKDQAAKHKIVVAQSDIDAQFAGRYKQSGSKSAYESYVKKAGFPNLVRVVAENNAYEAKLYGAVIATKNIFVVSINVDTPYLNSSKDPSVLRAQATNTMQTKFLPMFKKGWSNTKIAAQTNINLLSKSISRNIVGQYYTSMPSQADIVYNCTTATPCFNDQPNYILPGIVTAESKVESLTKVGQYTGVFTSKAGFIGIMRLDHESGGTYNSWSQLLQSYEEPYKSQLVAYLPNASMYNQTGWWT